MATFRPLLKNNFSYFLCKKWVNSRLSVIQNTYNVLLQQWISVIHYCLFDADVLFYLTLLQNNAVGVVAVCKQSQLHFLSMHYCIYFPDLFQVGTYRFVTAIKWQLRWLIMVRYTNFFFYRLFHSFFLGQGWDPQRVVALRHWCYNIKKQKHCAI